MLVLTFEWCTFRGELQHGGDVSQQKTKRRPIRTREIGGVSLSDVLYGVSLSDVLYVKVLSCDFSQIMAELMGSN